MIVDNKNTGYFSSRIKVQLMKPKLGLFQFELPESSNFNDRDMWTPNEQSYVNRCSFVYDHDQYTELQIVVTMFDWQTDIVSCCSTTFGKWANV